MGHFHYNSVVETSPTTDWDHLEPSTLWANSRKHTVTGLAYSPQTSMRSVETIHKNPSWNTITSQRPNMHRPCVIFLGGLHCVPGDRTTPKCLVFQEVWNYISQARITHLIPFMPWGCRVLDEEHGLSQPLLTLLHVTVCCTEQNDKKLLFGK